MDEQREYPFEFSVVMAVYNVEPFLREAVDSLIAQDFGFEKIQLIMVDDGSTDGSGAICDEYAQQYPDNVVVIHKENGGVASARNEGLKYASGRYLNFMDSDDKFTENAFSNVYDFFTANEAETDVVTIPLEFFDAQTGPHWQNEKFKKGTRVLDLYLDYQATIMFTNASFFAREVKNDIVFDPHLVCSEDMKVLLTLLIRKMKLGVVTGCQYMYRRRSVGEEGLIQTSKKKRGWYFDYFTYLVDWAVEFYQNRLGYLPSFLQYELLCDLQWRFGLTYNMAEVLTEEEVEQYKSRLFTTLRYFEDKYILEMKKIFAEHKYYMLSKKYGCAPTLTERYNDIMIHYGNSCLQPMSRHFSRIDFLRIEHGTLYMEGYTSLLGIDTAEPVEVFLLANGEKIRCEPVCRDSLNKYALGDLILRQIGFRIKMPLDPEIEHYDLRLLVRCRGVDILKAGPRWGKFAPLTTAYKNSYFYRQGYVLTVSGPEIHLKKCGRKGHLRHEWAFLKELWQKNRPGARKAIFARVLTALTKPFHRKKIWIISDRVNHAGDNGEALFDYLTQQRPKGIKAYFAISPSSPDYRRMKEKGRVIPFLGKRYKILYLLADCIISSQGEEYIFRPFQRFSEPYQDLSQTQKFIFLQHGVIHNDLSNWLNRYNKNIAMFVTTTIPEYRSILDYEYDYTPDVVKMIGLPRYDRLYHQEKRQVAIMPTWRAYLVSEMGPETGERTLKPGFSESRYYTMYQELLNNERLFDSAERYGYTIVLFRHPNMSSAESALAYSSKLQILNPNVPYRTIFAESDLLITDYSSVAFDFAYLRKPVLYYQTDRDEFFSGAHTVQKGYFDHERDGFGEVEYSADALVNRIIEYMENDCKLKEKYRKRIDATFPFSDQNNCQRVYEKILELGKQA